MLNKKSVEQFSELISFIKRKDLNSLPPVKDGDQMREHRIREQKRIEEEKRANEQVLICKTCYSQDLTTTYGKYDYMVYYECMNCGEKSEEHQMDDSAKKGIAKSVMYVLRKQLND
jgi:uncharacterized CHY-type Zn-finger protein